MNQPPSLDFKQYHNPTTLVESRNKIGCNLEMHVEFNFEFNILECVFDPLGNATMLLDWFANCLTGWLCWKLS
jgi:hypothetical protein